MLQVNGTNIVGWGIFGPGNGGFAFSAAGPFVPFTFALGHAFGPVTVNLSYAAPFVVGANTIKVFHNDNGAGIFGSGFSVANGELLFEATLSYETAGVVPEPGTWALLLAGAALVGGLVRRRTGGWPGSAGPRR